MAPDRPGYCFKRQIQCYSVFKVLVLLVATDNIVVLPWFGSVRRNIIKPQANLGLYSRTPGQFALL